MKIFSVLKGLNIIDCCEDFVISATTEEVCTIYFALRCVEEFHADQVDTQKTKELIETIKDDYFRRTDAEVHKPDYRYESKLMKRISDTNTNAPGSKSHMLRPPCEQCPDWGNCKDGCLYDKPKR